MRTPACVGIDGDPSKTGQNQVIMGSGMAESEAWPAHREGWFGAADPCALRSGLLSRHHEGFADLDASRSIHPQGQVRDVEFCEYVLPSIIMPRSNRAMRLQFTCQPNRVQPIQGTTNIVDWIPGSTNRTGGGVFWKTQQINPP